MKSNRRKIIIRGVISFFVAALVYNFVWNGFVISPTASVALEKKNGEQVVLKNIDNNRSFGIMRTQQGYYAYALSKNLWGWTVTDNIYLPKPTQGEKISFINDVLEYNDDRELGVILISSLDNNISYFEAYDKTGKEVILDTNRNQNTEINYGYTEKELLGELTIDGYSSDNKLLYRE